MKLLLDMNLSPTWVRFMEENGFEAVHWSTTGEPTATDAVIMAWARDRGFVVVTHDLDFSALLASTEALGPSVDHHLLVTGVSPASEFLEDFRG